MSFPIDFNLGVRKQLGFPFHHINFILFHEAGNPVPHFIHYIVFMFVCLRKVKSQTFCLNPKDRTMLGMMISLRSL